MIAKELLVEIEKSKSIVMRYITNVVAESEKFKDVEVDGKKVLIDEVVLSISYLKIGKAWMQQKDLKTIEEAKAFMDKIQGLIEKVYYATEYLNRVKNSLPQKQ